MGLLRRLGGWWSWLIGREGGGNTRGGVGFGIGGFGVWSEHVGWEGWV